MSNRGLYQYIQIQVLAGLFDLLNSLWWYDGDLNKILAKSADNLISTGYTLTKADTSNYYADDWIIRYDGSNIRTHITVVGDGVSYTDTIAEEYTPSLGDEYEIIHNKNIKTVNNARLFALQAKKKHTYANIYIQLSLDLYIAEYPLIKTGTLIDVDYPDGGTPTISHDDLLVHSIDFVIEQGVEEMILTLQRRDA